MLPASDGQIITFYSYKGGTGRSLALANLAWILASNGKRVLAIDWDLEAPGLHRYFHPFLEDKELTRTRGVIEFVRDFEDAALAPLREGEQPAADWYEPLAKLERYAVPLRWRFDKPGGLLDFVPAGQQGPAYAAQVNAFNWSDFYNRLGGGTFLEAARTHLKTRYEYILIDSRTGVSDSAGVCTVQMPDILVVCFTLNTQSIEGAAAVACTVSEQRQKTRPLKILPVAMRVDVSEKDKLDSGRDYVKTKFAAFLPDSLGKSQERNRYWGEMEVPYWPYYAYEEILVAFGDKPDVTISLLAPLERLASYLTGGSVSQLVAVSEEVRQEVLARFKRQPQKRELETLLRDNPEWRPLAEQTLQKQTQWKENAQADTLLLEESVVRQLRAAPELIVALLENADFYAFWDESVAVVQRQARQALLRPVHIYLMCLCIFAMLFVSVGLFWSEDLGKYPTFRMGVTFLFGTIASIMTFFKKLVDLGITDKRDLLTRIIVQSVMAGGIIAIVTSALMNQAFIEMSVLTAAAIGTFLGFVFPEIVDRLNAYAPRDRRKLSDTK